MAKIRETPIVSADVEEYISQQSDFSFEQRVFAELNRLGFHGDHGGTYIDAFTGKPREFDIRVRKSLTDGWSGGVQLSLHMAVECKNLKTSCPLLVECVPRSRMESHHGNISAGGQGESGARRIDPSMVYREKEPVGKSCSLVAKKENGEFAPGSDQGVYDKWAQALSSLSDLVVQAKAPGDTQMIRAALIPFLVLPDDCLWVVDYDGQGNLMGCPRQVEHIPYLVRRTYTFRHLGIDRVLHVSHLEFCTIGGLEHRLADLCHSPSEYLCQLS